MLLPAQRGFGPPVMGPDPEHGVALERPGGAADGEQSEAGRRERVQRSNFPGISDARAANCASRCASICFLDEDPS